MPNNYRNLVLVLQRSALPGSRKSVIYLQRLADLKFIEKLLNLNRIHSEIRPLEFEVCFSACIGSNSYVQSICSILVAVHSNFACLFAHSRLSFKFLEC